MSSLYKDPFVYWRMISIFLIFIKLTKHLLMIESNVKILYRTITHARPVVFANASSRDFAGKLSIGGVEYDQET